MKRAYITLGPESDLDGAVAAALRWCLPLVGPEHPETVLWLPHRDCLDDLPFTRRLVHKGLKVVSDRPGRRGPKPTPSTGPVIAYRHSMDRLAEIEPAPHTPVVLIGACAPETEPLLARASTTFHKPWIDAFDPEHLAGSQMTSSPPLVEDPLAAQAMRTFTSTTRSGETMYRSDDGGRVTHGLMLLRQHGHRLDPHEWYTAALRSNWPGVQAKRLRTIVDELAQGRDKRPAAEYTSSMYEQWVDASEGGAAPSDLAVDKR